MFNRQLMMSCIYSEFELFEPYKVSAETFLPSSTLLLHVQIYRLHQNVSLAAQFSLNSSQNAVHAQPSSHK